MNTILKLGSKGDDVAALQQRLSAAGYRLNVDGDFGPGTEHAVESFQRQHGLTVDGEAGPEVEASLASAPPHALVAAARPMLDETATWPHDDTASLTHFYGQPWKDGSLIVHVPVPFEMVYKTDHGAVIPFRAIPFHRKAAPALANVLAKIAAASVHDASVLDHVGIFAGSYNYRAIRGSARLSCHAFAAAIDFDPDRLPMGERVADGVVHPAVVKAFDDEGFFWGNRYKGRPDPMHWAAAHE